MKRWLILVLVIVIPAAAFLNVWQVYRYRQLERDITELEDKQLELIEKNRRLIAGMSVYQSPQRLEQLAEGELNLRKIEPGMLIRIQTKEKDETDD